METNNLFSFQRFMLLCKQSLIINKKMIGIALIGFAGTLFITLLLFQSRYSNINSWGIENDTITFFFMFIILGIIYTSLSFPAFRSKEKSMTYLMLPASTSEKFVFELVSRFIVFIVLMPVLFWSVTNLEGVIVHHFVPSFEHYRFSFNEDFRNYFTRNGKLDDPYLFFFLQLVLFGFIFSFAGASHFSKSPLLKTLFAFTIIVAGYMLFILIMVKVLHLNYNNMPFVNDKNDLLKFFNYSILVINLSLLAISFFRLKEKET